MASRRLLIIGLIAFLAAVAGVFVGRILVDAPRANETELHALLHRELKLSADQEKKIHLIEARFAARRDALELEMRAANIRLAQAIDAPVLLIIPRVFVFVALAAWTATLVAWIRQSIGDITSRRRARSAVT